MVSFAYEFQKWYCFAGNFPYTYYAALDVHFIHGSCASFCRVFNVLPRFCESSPVLRSQTFFFLNAQGMLKQSIPLTTCKFRSIEGCRYIQLKENIVVLWCVSFILRPKLGQVHAFSVTCILITRLIMLHLFVSSMCNSMLCHIALKTFFCQ